MAGTAGSDAGAVDAAPSADATTDAGGTALCQPITCEQSGQRLCGVVGDGCGHPLDCATCPGNEACGQIVPHVCGHGPRAPEPVACDKLCKQQVSCEGGRSTTVSGTVYAPTPAKFGKADPLYGVFVYVPNAPVMPFAAGVACDVCSAPLSGSPIATTLTGADGRFVLRNVPVGQNIPLVIQVGRWRRQITIPKVEACQDTALAADLTRLPRNKMEGDIPAIAIGLGSYDPLECTLRKIGIDEAEFTAPTGNGRVHLYRGTAAAPSYDGAVDLIGDQTSAHPGALDKYDVAIFPCNETPRKLPAALYTRLVQYGAKGGRLFFTDKGSDFMYGAPEYRVRVTWPDEVWDEQPIWGEDYPAFVDKTFPKGEVYARWLMNVGASKEAAVLPIHDPHGGVVQVAKVKAPTQAWLSVIADPSGTDSTHTSVPQVSFNTPAEATGDKQCGRVVFSNFHASGESAADGKGTVKFPVGCPDTPLTADEKAIEFMLFDVSACVRPDDERPQVFDLPPAAPATMP